jgi:hypothetical protein
MQIQRGSIDAARSVRRHKYTAVVSVDDRHDVRIPTRSRHRSPIEVRSMETVPSANSAYAIDSESILDCWCRRLL